MDVQYNNNIIKIKMEISKSPLWERKKPMKNLLLRKSTGDFLYNPFGKGS
jgi:hypothetical protein